MMDASEFLGLGKYLGGQNAPIGTYINLRTLAYYQQTSDGTLPADGNVWILLTLSGTSTTTQIATALNLIVPGSAYVAGSFHSRTSADNAQQAGTGSDDA